MNVLAIETGGANWGVACTICDAQRGTAALLSAHTSDQPRELSQQLFGVIQSTLDAAHWNLDDVDALAVGLGPGSWTGLRIGLSTAKTLAQTRNWKLAGVPSFDAFAQAVWRARDEDASTLLLVSGACRPGSIYAKIYEAGADYLAVLQTEWIGANELVADTLSTEALSHGLEAPHLLCGTESQTIAALLNARGEKYSFAAPEFQDVLLELAVAGATQIESGAIENGESNNQAMTLQPLYLAPSNAERNWIERNSSAR